MELRAFKIIIFFYQEKSENGQEEENFFFRVTEAIFVGWFTLEFLIRFVVSPSKVINYDLKGQDGRTSFFFSV